MERRSRLRKIHWRSLLIRESRSGPSLNRNQLKDLNVDNMFCHNRHLFSIGTLQQSCWEHNGAGGKFHRFIIRPVSRSRLLLEKMPLPDYTANIRSIEPGFFSLFLRRDTCVDQYDGPCIRKMSRHRRIITEKLRILIGNGNMARPIDCQLCKISVRCAEWLLNGSQ